MSLLTVETLEFAVTPHIHMERVVRSGLWQAVSRWMRRQAEELEGRKCYFLLQLWFPDPSNNTPALVPALQPRWPGTTVKTAKMSKSA